MRNEKSQRRNPEQIKEHYKNNTDLAKWGTQRGTQGNSGGLSEGIRGTHGELRELRPPIFGELREELRGHRPHLRQFSTIVHV
jgi:hypothetical protein